MMTSDELFQESFEFIRKNLSVSLDQIPRHLRQFWLTSGEPGNYEEESEQWTVFMFALALYEAAYKGNEQFTTNIEELGILFTQWQILLSVAELQELTDLTIAPLNIFDFDNYNKINTKATGPTDWLSMTPYARDFMQKEWPMMILLGVKGVS